MSFENFKTNSYCVAGWHRSATTKTSGDITSKGGKVLFGHCSICNRKKWMTGSNNTIQAEGQFHRKHQEEVLLRLVKKATNVSKNPGRALEMISNIPTAAANRKPENVLSTLPEVIKF